MLTLTCYTMASSWAATCRVPEDASQAVQDLILDCMAEDPKGRPEAAKLQQTLDSLSSLQSTFGADVQEAGGAADRHGPIRVAGMSQVTSGLGW